MTDLIRDVFDWLLGLSGESVLSLVAVTIALLSLYVQARSERRNARLVLFERRLELAQAINEAISFARFIAWSAMPTGEFARYAKEVSDADVEKLSKLTDAFTRAQKSARYMFGPEVTRALDSAFVLLHSVLVDARALATSNDVERKESARTALADFDGRLMVLEGIVQETVEQYLVRERAVGAPLLQPFRQASQTRRLTQTLAVSAGTGEAIAPDDLPGVGPREGGESGTIS